MAEYDYSSEETAKMASANRAMAIDNRDLPSPFDPHEPVSADEGEQWYSDERQIADWADSADPRFNAAVEGLTVRGLAHGIRLAERVAEEHRRRAGNADSLAHRLRSAAARIAEVTDDAPTQRGF